MESPELTPAQLKALAPKAQAAAAYMSRNGKSDREEWVLEHWRITSQRPKFTKKKKGEGPDFIVDGEFIEIVEVQKPARSRHKEYKEDVQILEYGYLPGPDGAIDLDQVRDHAYEWNNHEIFKKADKYKTSARNWTLIVYANYGWCEQTQWARVRQFVTSSITTFKAIHILSADGKHVETVKP